MKKFISFLHMDKKLLFQFMLVIVAFLIMVVLSSVFGSRIVNSSVASYGEEVMNSSVETLKAYLDKYQTTLDDIAFSAERVRNAGGDIDEIQEDLVSWTDWILGRDQEFEAFLSIYCVVDDVMIDGQYVEPPEGYVPQSRPWYIGALEKNGEVHFCDPYVDVRTGEIILTVSKLMYDKNGSPFGVIAIDVFITSTADFVNNLGLMGSGYGMLLDENRSIVVHPDSALVGTKLEDVNDGDGGYSEIASRLAIGKEVSAFPYTSYTGVKSVAFFQELFNGWYVGVVSPSKAYYSEVVTMIVLLSVVGVILIVLLCTIMAFLHIEKNRSEKANKMKSSFLANMSHEIRTPMNAVIGMSELLIKEQLNSRQQGYIKDINMSAHSLLSIINDILDLSKVEAGKLELSPVDYDFQVFMDNVSSMFRFVSEKKELEYKFETVGEMPKCLFGDDIKLRQVLVNICGNAIKFTDKGFIGLKITATAETLIFEIEDTGMGIRKEEVSKLFEPFAQTDLQKNRNIIGTGLGLPISKTFVEMMGGKVVVDSVYGKGTVFTVTIPKVIGDESAIRYENKESKENPFFAPTAKILIVDDNEVNLKVAGGLLSLYKIQADTVMSGKEAIRRIKETEYDIVFMDHMMPEMDGVETTKEIRKLGGKYKQLTILALTANAVRGAKEMFLENGMNDFISKPIEMDELAQMLRAWLPAEKIQEENKTMPEIEDKDSESENDNKEEQNGFLYSLKAIDDINIEIGMSRVSGLEDMYRETLELFNKKVLGECEKMDGFLNNKELHSLAISVHGMKSSLSTIGAMELSEAAFKLETASKNEELSFCEEHLPELLKKLGSLQEQLSVIFPNEKSALSRPEGDLEYLRENIQEALAAADDFDMDAGATAINKLLAFDFGEQTNESLERASGALVDFDFDAAIEFLKGIE